MKEKNGKMKIRGRGGEGEPWRSLVVTALLYTRIIVPEVLRLCLKQCGMVGVVRYKITAKYRK